MELAVQVRRRLADGGAAERVLAGLVLAEQASRGCRARRSSWRTRRAGTPRRRTGRRRTRATWSNGTMMPWTVRPSPPDRISMSETNALERLSIDGGALLRVGVPGCICTDTKPGIGLTRGGMSPAERGGDGSAALRRQQQAPDRLRQDEHGVGLVLLALAKRRDRGLVVPEPRVPGTSISHSSAWQCGFHDQRMVPSANARMAASNTA